MARDAAQLIVSGAVQGVGYRFWVHRSAEMLGLTGWVRNLDDGRVEIYVEGEGPAIAALMEACKHGPRAAAVEGVTRRPMEPRGEEKFSILKDAPRPEE